MRFWRIKGQRLLARGVSDSISKRAERIFFALWSSWDTSALLIADGALASPKRYRLQSGCPGDQFNRKAPPAMAWIPGGAFLMGTNDKESFPNERPAHLVFRDRGQSHEYGEKPTGRTRFGRTVEARTFCTRLALS
jgi:formylglycine-generating enzyme required for sulfatase activity